MHDLINFFDVRDIVPLVLLIWLLQFVGSCISGNNGTVLWLARTFAAAGFLLYAAVVIDAWRPTQAAAFFVVGVQAMLAMGTIHGLAYVTLPVLCFLYRHLWSEPLARHRAWKEQQEREAEAEKAARDEEEKRKAEQARAAEFQRQIDEELARRPPPPTHDELLTAAREQHEKKLRMLAASGLKGIELKAAQDKAQQKYLRELDDLL